MNRTALACALAAAAVAAPAGAEELSYAHYVSSVHPMVTGGIQPFFERVTEATGGDITWNVYWGGAMGEPKELLGAIDDGIVDAAGIVDVYLKSQLPSSALLSSLFVVADDVLAYAAAMNEYQTLHCPSCLEDYHEHNVIPLAWYSTSPYLLMCTSDASTLDALAGKKVRATSRMGTLMQSMGATPVSVTSAEMYEAMQRGTIDCSVGAAAWLTGYNIKDFVTQIVEDPLGAYIGAMVMNMNADVWADLSDDNRQAIMDNLPKLVGDTMWAYLAEADDAVKQSVEGGAKLVPAGDDFRTKLEEIRPGEWEAAIAQGEADGIENAREMIEGFRKTVEKWQGLMEEIGDDKEAYEAALEREIYSKYDPAL